MRSMPSPYDDDSLAKSDPFRDTDPTPPMGIARRIKSTLRGGSKAGRGDVPHTLAQTTPLIGGPSDPFAGMDFKLPDMPQEEPLIGGPSDPFRDSDPTPPRGIRRPKL